RRFSARELQHREIARGLVTRQLRVGGGHHGAQLRAEQQIAGAEEDPLHPFSLWARYAPSRSEATRSCFRVSRSRTVTVASCVDWPSIVMPNGVPASSWRRSRPPSQPPSS